VPNPVPADGAMSINGTPLIGGAGNP
jgi:hypothetical protein